MLAVSPMLMCGVLRNHAIVGVTLGLSLLAHSPISNPLVHLPALYCLSQLLGLTRGGRVWYWSGQLATSCIVLPSVAIGIVSLDRNGSALAG